MFSTRTPPSLAPNPLTAAVARRRAEGATLFDLTSSNPTRAGIVYPSERILAALATPQSLSYEPDPRGVAVAREAVANYYAERGARVDPSRLLLTASTSEAYALLFKVLGDAGDEVLVPTPSYPLFEHLARIESLEPVAYPLAYDRGWSYDADLVRERVTSRTRAVVVVSPNNPTGSTLSRPELDAIVEICRERGIALVCDEVFADYATGEDPRLVPTVAGTEGALTFALNGLSKVAGLPQVKLGWVATSGPEALAAEALARLEFAADLFLSVGTPVQRALPELLALAPEVRDRIRERVGENRAWLAARAGEGSCPCDVLSSPHGWYAVLRIPRVVPEEELVLALVEREGVVAHPGYFFDFEQDGLLVLSLLPPPETFREGAGRAIGYVERLCSR